MIMVKIKIKMGETKITKTEPTWRFQKKTIAIIFNLKNNNKTENNVTAAVRKKIFSGVKAGKIWDIPSHEPVPLEKVGKDLLEIARK